MRDRGVDGDDEVEGRDYGRRVGEVTQFAAQVDQIAAAAEVVRVGGADVLLQADEASAGNVGERRQARERDGTLVVPGIVRVPRPGKTDTHPVCRQTQYPCRDPIGGGAEGGEARPARRW